MLGVTGPHPAAGLRRAVAEDEKAPLGDGGWTTGYLRPPADPPPPWSILSWAGGLGRGESQHRPHGRHPARGVPGGCLGARRVICGGSGGPGRVPELPNRGENENYAFLLVLVSSKKTKLYHRIFVKTSLETIDNFP